MAATSLPAQPSSHPPGYRARRFLNWFPLGLTYALLYMGRYNLTVAKTSLGDLMTKEDFGVIFGAGTFVYALAFLFNGPLVDKQGGRRGMIVAALGSMVANASMGFYLQHVLASANPADAPLRLVFSVLYAANMYFQSFAAVSIVKVNAHWFHVTERGSFSGIFGTMISSGIFLAFTVNGWLLDTAAGFAGKPAQWIVFLAPSVLLGLMAVVAFFLLRDSPGKAGFADFDTGDASSGEEGGPPLPTREVFRRLLTNPVILTVAAIEFCTGVLRNGVMHWFPIYAAEVWVLPQHHVLMRGSWDSTALVAVCWAIAAVSGFLASRSRGSRRGAYAVGASLAFLAPFVQGGWGGLLFIAGVIGGNVAGWVSDLFFQSRRGPAAAGLYIFLALCTLGMIFVLSPPTNVVAQADEKSGLQAGDQIVSIAGTPVEGWADIRKTVACIPASCTDSVWDAKACTCSTSASGAAVEPPGHIAATIVRGGERLAVELPDPNAVMRAGDSRRLQAQPVLPMSPWLLGGLVFLLSLSVIGVHGLLSGTATMDFGGRKAAATATGVIDGFVYLGTAVQSLSLGYLTSRSWAYWPLFLLPFAVIGALLCLRIWNAKPKSARKAPAAPAEAKKQAA